MKRRGQGWRVFLILFIALMAACTPSVPDKTGINETAVAAASTLLTQTMTAVPTLTGTPTSTVPMPTATIIPGPSPTPWPDFEITQIPGLLESALTVESLPAFNGHALQRVSGWRYGFDRVEWLDADHIVLYPYAGVTNLYLDAMGAGTYPAVLNRDLKKLWIPTLSEQNVYGRTSLPGSAQLGVLIIPDGKTVNIYNPDGALLKSHPGPLLSVSPSGTKILVGDGTWIDLNRGRTVKFAWQQTGVASEYASYGHSTPVWSPDEMSVFNCCYVYGDARTGRSLAMPFDGVTIDGKKAEGSLLAYGALWVMNDRYILPWGGYWEGPLFSVYLFDPLAKTFRDISVVTGIPHGSSNDVDTYCDEPSAQNGGRYAWVDCQDGGHLIDLETFQAQSYPPFVGPDGIAFFPSDEKWSADGTFVLLGSSLYSGAGGGMHSLPDDCFDASWHPKDNVLLCAADHGSKLLLLDARTAAVQKEVTLPSGMQQRLWSPEGKQIALAAPDGSLWQIDYPNLNYLVQLTAPMPELTRPIPEFNTTQSLIEKMAWSADGSAIAFIGSQDVYIVSSEVVP